MSFLNHTRNFKGIADVFMRDANRYLPLLQFIQTIMEADSEFSQNCRRDALSFNTPLEMHRHIKCEFNFE